MLFQGTRILDSLRYIYTCKKKHVAEGLGLKKTMKKSFGKTRPIWSSVDCQNSWDRLTPLFIRFWPTVWRWRKSALKRFRKICRKIKRTTGEDFFGANWKHIFFLLKHVILLLTNLGCNVYKTICFSFVYNVVVYFTTWHYVMQYDFLARSLKFQRFGSHMNSLPPLIGYVPGVSVSL